MIGSGDLPRAVKSLRDDNYALPRSVRMEAPRIKGNFHSLTSRNFGFPVSIFTFSYSILVKSPKWSAAKLGGAPASCAEYRSTCGSLIVCFRHFAALHLGLFDKVRLHLGLFVRCSVIVLRSIPAFVTPSQATNLISCKTAFMGYNVLSLRGISLPTPLFQAKNQCILLKVFWQKS